MSTLLLTVDALRATHLRQYGYYRDTMPALDRLTEDGTIFADAYANAPYTRLSIPSFHTSRYRGHELIGETPTIASVLSDAGVHTACLGTLTGFKDSEGELVFDEYRDLGRDEFYERANRAPLLNAAKTAAKPILRRVRPAYRAAETAYDKLFSTHEFKSYTDAAEMTDAVIEWMSAPPEDFFLWVHYMEGHRPYGVHNDDPEYLDEQPDEDIIKHLMKTAGTNPDNVTMGENRLIEDLYDSDLRYCSAHLDRLFDFMQQEGLWAETDIYLTSDHGEEFYDHGMYYHRNLPHDELLHVPLFVKRGGDDPGRVDETRELLDLAPTICEAHGVEVTGLPFRGQHLLRGDDRHVIATGSAAIDDAAVVAGRWGGWKYISNGGDVTLYDLDAGSGEHVSVAEEHPDVVRSFEAEIPDALFDLESPETRTPDDEVDEERLAALGYMEV